ncbi:hypothetical protein KGQ27_02285 [Patescibacteria group bacterium]|nr:hypothetical protein [Patescibacteria group bacterium]MDE1946394.1 hypothetical protein [Patescibacteria group bacterium]MDE2011003.1 hypothetical protein [Patescibacteria group bacterium]MDE2233026.1 hypothetical protein [Patescibacteria group bacterium]
MMYIQNWGDVFTQSLQSVWYGVANFVPGLVIAIIIFAIGWVLAALVERLVESILKSLKLDAALKSAGMEDVVKRAGYNLNSGRFVGVLCKWFVIVVFLMAAFDVLGLQQVNDFLRQVVNYLPQVIVAVLILMVSAVVANAMNKTVVASSKAGHIKSAEFLGKVTKWAIWIFAILTALITLGIAPALIQMIITAIFAGAALAIGLAFGLGGKDAAQKWIEKTSQHLQERD